MEQREENTNNIKRRRKSSSLSESASSSSSLSLPLDLTTEIFLKLPMKSAYRFRCVSKLWSSITADPYFINSLKTRAKLLFFFRVGNKFFVFTIPQHNQNPNESDSYSSSQTYDSYHITFPKDCYFTIRTESVHGLICFQKVATPIFWKLTVWNPRMRKFLHLRLRKPADRNFEYITAFLRYDPIEGKHKLVCMPCYQLRDQGSSECWVLTFGSDQLVCMPCWEYRDKASDECWILTLGSDQELWRTVKTNYKHFPLSSNRSISSGPCKCIHGVLYYLAYIDSNQVIMSFDVRSEKFHLIKLQWNDRLSHHPVMMISYKERLACLRSNGRGRLLMWVLEDAQKGEWSRTSRKFSPLSQFDQYSKRHFKLIGMSNDGELIYVPKSVLESFDVIYIDPTRKTCRRVNYKGIADKEFRQRNGLGNERLRFFQYFPNHIQTLTCL